jgi:hypothetical protein
MKRMSVILIIALLLVLAIGLTCCGKGKGTYTPYRVLLEVNEVDPSTVSSYENRSVQEVWMDLKCTEASKKGKPIYIRAEVSKPMEFASKDAYMTYIKGVINNLKGSQVMILGDESYSPVIPGKRRSGIVKVVEHGKRRVIVVPRKQLKIIENLDPK